MTEYDVLVVGGGVAGLQAALTLGRDRRRVLLADDGHQRNAPARHVHNFLGQPATSPAELLATARAMLSEYAVTILPDRVTDVRPGFTASTADGGAYAARAIVLATGMRDELPDVPGLAGLWGDLAVACPHCHGWEVRDEPLAQLGFRGLPERGVQRALLLSNWSGDVVFFTDGDDLADADHDRLAKAGVRVRTERVARVHPDAAVELVTGETVRRRTVFTVVRQHQQTDLAERLGCVLTSEGGVEADLVGRTAVPGVWAAGTTAMPGLLAIGAAGHASTVAVAVNAALMNL